MTRARTTQLAALGLSAAVLVGCGKKQELTHLPATPTRVAVSIGGPPGAVDAPLYAAGALGDFARAGLAVTFQSSADGTESLAKLSSGAVNLAIASEPDVLAARAQGQQVVSIATLEQGPLEALISIPPSSVTKVAGLTGKTVAIGATPATGGQPLARAELETMLRSAGVPAAGVHTIDAGRNPIAALKAHRADGALGGRWNVEAIALELQHRKPNVIKISDAGVPTFNDAVVVARMSDARSHGDLLRTFLQALTRAAHAQAATPAAALDALLSAEPSLNRRIESGSLQATLPILDPPGKGLTFGHQDPLVWRTFGTWMLTNGLLTVRSDAGLAVDNEFLPGEGE
ncbi:MAG: putative hydroxymethylpyrimidine transport system substrate-binding protein [Solirubrobacteraceae bacterium]|jgi:ABC-type nitrate/sulfonate/bicarbonate transport system substrate-binding protein|nr:putative hydroxymethylpyrimidine transport system substrate-binding protein [Solirubrobacteraceae bacterium]